MNNELLQSAKDEAAREYGFKDWNEFQRCLSDVLRHAHDYEEPIINRAMEIYAEKVNGWVSVSEKMPELNQWVLADYGYKIPIIFCYKGDGNWLSLDTEVWATDDGIKQWMPLPNKHTKTTKP